MAPSASPTGPPEVPEGADHAAERRVLTKALWDMGRTRTAADTASPKSTTVRRVDSPVPPKGWRLLLFRSLHSPDFGVYAAAGPDGAVAVLSSNPEGHQRFAKDAGLRVGSAEEAIATAEFFLETTRLITDHQKVLRKGSDALLTTADPKAKDAAEKRIDGEVAAPKARRTGEGYEVTLYLQRVANVDRWTGTVSANGSVEGSFTTVAEDLPVSFPHR